MESKYQYTIGDYYIIDYHVIHGDTVITVSDTTNINELTNGTQMTKGGGVMSVILLIVTCCVAAIYFVRKKDK